MPEKEYSSLESVFESVLNLMKQQDDEEIYRFLDRLKVVVQKAERVGWGYSDIIVDLLEEYHPDF